MIGVGEGKARMTVSPSEQHGVPAEEGIEDADVRDDLGNDPDSVPNAPNRDPAAPPDHVNGDDSEVPSGFESFEHTEHDADWGAEPPH